MACPLCGRDGCSCTVAQSRARTAPRICFPHQHDPEYVDPEVIDSSEQQFEDSLLSSPAAEYRSIDLGSQYDHLDERFANDDRTSQSPVERPVSGIERHAVDQRSLDQQSENWRDEVASRLNNYAKKRGRKRLAGEYSMQLDFERSRRSAAATAAALAPIMEEPEPEVLASAAELPEFDPQPAERTWAEPVRDDVIPGAAIEHNIFEPAPPINVAPPAPKRKQPRVIQFPRLFAIEQVESPSDELAEPLNKPRILDVPEETEQIVLPLADISMELHEAAEDAAPVRDFDVPIQVAGISQRVFAAIADSTIVLFATAIFAGVVLNIAKGLPHNKLTLMVGALVPCVFWGLYHYLFLVHAATTPGMSAAQLRLATFNGTSTTRQSRRARALSLVLSFVSAGMGFGWAFVDEDTLCWHDRISRTYLKHR